MVSIRQLTYCFALLLIGSVQCSISIENNGYSGLLVAISEAALQPQDGGTAFISQLQDLLRETSAALYEATNHRAYFKSVDILLPSSWNPIAGIDVTNTQSHSFNSADLRIASQIKSVPVNPSTYMEIAMDDLSREAIKDQSQLLLAKWFQYRYDIDFDPESRYFYEEAQGQGMIDYVVSVVRNVLQASKALPLERSADFLDSNTPRNDIDPLPVFRFLRATPFVVYMAVDTSSPVGNNPLSTAKTALRAFINSFESTDPIRFAVSSFEGSDKGPGSYLQEKLPPTGIAGSSSINNAINALTTNTAEYNRNVGAALRDAIVKLQPYKDQGGSILYVVTSSQSMSSELELQVVEGLLANNIQLVAIEAGAGTHKALERFSVLSKAYYYPTSAWVSSFFTPIHTIIRQLAARNPLIIDRKIVFTGTSDIVGGSSWSGSFQVPADQGTSTVVAFHSSLKGSFTLSINGPDGSSYTATSGPSSTNWNDPAATVGLTSVAVSYFDGEWKFEIKYDSSSCPDCLDGTVMLQVTSSSFNGVRTSTTEASTDTQTSPNADTTTTEITSSLSSSAEPETGSSSESTVQTDPPTTQGPGDTTISSSTTLSSSSEGTTSSSTSTTTQRTETSTGTTEATTWTTLETTVCIPFAEFRPREAQKKVVYVVVDTSFPVGNNPISTVRRTLKALVLKLPQDSYFGLASFQGTYSGSGSYLQERLGLTQISADSTSINAAIDTLLSSGTSITQRDVGAALRDGIEKIKSYKDEDGSILYIISCINGGEENSVMELDISESLISNRIQLVAVEAGTETPNSKLKSLDRLSTLTNGFYYYTPTYGSDAFFNPSHNQTVAAIQDPIETGRRVLLHQKYDSGATNWTGSFTIDGTSNVDAVVALQWPKGIDVTVEITRPNGGTLSLTSNGGGNNWNVPSATTGVSSLNLASPAVPGRWTYVISSSGSGPITLQVTSTLNSGDTSSSPTDSTTSEGQKIPEQTITEQITTTESTTTEESTTEQTTTTESTTTEESTTEQTTTTTESTTTEELTSEQTTPEQSTTTVELTSEQTTTAQSTTTEDLTSEQTTSEKTTTEELTSEQTTTEDATTSETTSEATSSTGELTTATTEASTTVETTTSEGTTTTDSETTTSVTDKTTDGSTTSEATTSPEVTSTEYSSTICYTSTTIMTTLTDGHSSTTEGLTDYTTDETTEESTSGSTTTTESSTTTGSATTEDPGDGLGTAEIVGIAVGSAAGAAIIVGGSVYAIKKSSGGRSSRGFTSNEAAVPPPPPAASARPPPPVTSGPPPPIDPPSKPVTDYGRLEPSAGRSLPQPAQVAEPEHFIKPSLYDQIDEVELGVTFEDDDALLTAL